MFDHSRTFLLAETLFETFQGRTDLLTAQQIANSGILSSLGHMTNVPGIVGFYDLDGRKARQRLSLGKNGIYFFVTTFTDPGGEVVHRHISPRTDNYFAELDTSVFNIALRSSVDIA